MGDPRVLFASGHAGSVLPPFVFSLKSNLPGGRIRSFAAHAIWPCPDRAARSVMASDSPPLPVLVADDSEVACKLVKEILVLEGLSVETFPDGADALATYEPGRYRLMILDIIMPRKGGVELAREVRERGDETPIVLISSYRPEKAVLAIETLKAVTFLKKPFTPAELRAAVKAAIGA